MLLLLLFYLQQVLGQPRLPSINQHNSLVQLLNHIFRHIEQSRFHLEW